MLALVIVVLLVVIILMLAVPQSQRPAMLNQVVAVAVFASVVWLLPFLAGIGYLGLHYARPVLTIVGGVVMGATVLFCVVLFIIGILSVWYCPTCEKKVRKLTICTACKGGGETGG